MMTGAAFSLLMVEGSCPLALRNRSLREFVEGLVQECGKAPACMNPELPAAPFDDRSDA